ncbi:DUF6959 family protein [Blastococcus litoris]|uniref:DUF6959 family protein n=1 Tax=Blastococcus litoris TaxID=2171622 RepID=UPI0013E0C740|nr:hypothetical protein [Blastococcus litoris]
MSMVRWLGVRGNVQLVHGEGRRFPGLLVQGDTLFNLLEELESGAPDPHAVETVRSWLSAYEEMMAEHGLDLPYSR